MGDERGAADGISHKWSARTGLRRALEGLAAAEEGRDDWPRVCEAEIEDEKGQGARISEVTAETAPLEFEIGGQRHPHDDNNGQNENGCDQRLHGRKAAAAHGD